MPKATVRPPSPTEAQFGSDVIVDVLRALGIDYVALNPGATFRGLHDSLVNYGGNRQPEIILCNHEEVAVAMAHGYARAAGKPMAAAVHDIVGLLHATNSIYNAWLDRAGLLVLGGTGPMAAERRRPWIDWVHTALVQGNAVRDYVKWDDQPASIPSVLEALLRAHQLATTEPQGPVYLCFDAALQEQRLEEPFVLPDLSRYAAPSRVQADPRALDQAADMLLNSERPVVIADYLGASPEAVQGLQSLAEALAMPVIDLGDLFNFPSRHPMNLTEAADDLLAEADVVLALNVPDLQQPLTTADRTSRLATPRIPKRCRIIDISLRPYAVRSWAQDYGRLHAVDLAIAADVALAVPTLAELVGHRLAQGRSRSRAARLQERAARWRAKHEKLAQQASLRARQTAGERPIAPPFLAQQVWEVAQGHDWVLTDTGLLGWCRRLWDIQHPYQYLAARGGLANGLGRSLGVALAHRNTGRLCIDFQADGDLLYTPSSLWTAAHHRIPLLVVMYNNRSYYNDEEHQAAIARSRGRPEENRVIGIRVEDPPVDFAALARSFGVHGEGPVETPEDLRPALERALRVVTQEGRCALVDVVIQNR